ncbi:hypothetical protein SAMD00019534_014230 [Acytostelium subglobosum LB1]|uniref:hypothetical protein n=1 Tax=Acytostelium subglobosum LB1 TaxID=1410327 RepID=UPI0006449A4D|nr:hypothetical protein SAMD00019534_014230 [Acytostelium subglobosum LB1]GAM18248.1 hypothetical protein SAMD00019534_014230 [Acytostelium subglobosum LB1]|eukprot:XP_012758844.1 hypothetical protein SAMD00019534_014230 [Acytostelium subglobosum LB1]
MTSPSLKSVGSSSSKGSERTRVPTGPFHESPATFNSPIQSIPKRITRLYPTTSPITKKIAKNPIGRPRSKRPDHCFICKVTKTPEWRKGDNGVDVCNACGLKIRKEREARKMLMLNNILNKEEDNNDIVTQHDIDEYFQSLSNRLTMGDNCIKFVNYGQHLDHPHHQLVHHINNKYSPKRAIIN